MPNAIAYGKALYYPYIHFQDEHWLKTAALYYDGLFRMLPDYYQPQDSDIVKRIIGELGFVENLPTRQAARTISNHFLEYFEREFGKKNQRAAFHSTLRRADRSKQLQALHIHTIG